MDEEEYTCTHFSNKRMLESTAERSLENNNVVTFSDQIKPDDSKKANSKEHIVPEPLTENVSSNTQNKESKTELLTSKKRVDAPQKSTNTNAKGQKKLLAVTNDTFPNDDFSFKDTIINTSTPTTSICQSVTDDQVIQETTEESPIRETRKSKYFIRNNRSISVAKEGSSL